MTLSSRKVNEFVEIGTGHSGRILRKGVFGTEAVHVLLFDEWMDCEDRHPTLFPGEVGVRSVRPASMMSDNSGDSRGREDYVDPLQRKRLL